VGGIRVWEAATGRDGHEHAIRFLDVAGIGLLVCGGSRIFVSIRMEGAALRSRPCAMSDGMLMGDV